MLLAFDSAARTGSFTAAAKELNLTQGAISRQVAALENQLDVTLFTRTKKTVQLNDIGRAYAQEIHGALQRIRSASLNAMTSPLNGILNLAILPTFGTRWLMPKIPQFLERHPEITINFVSKLSPFDFRTENLHSAIHYGTPNWNDTVSTFIMNEKAIPVCSPKLLQQYRPMTLDKLLGMPLLHLESRPYAWANWLSHNGLEPTAEQGMLFEEFSTIAQAAVTGLGAALLPTILIQGEMDRKELVAISDVSFKDESGYYLVTPTDKMEYPPNSAFRKWLVGAAKELTETGI